MELPGGTATQVVVDVSEWFDWLRRELPLGGVQLPDEESATLLIYQALHTVKRAQSIYRHLPDSLMDELTGAALVYGCWKVQHDLRERLKIPRVRPALPVCVGTLYLGMLGKSGSHHLIEVEDGSKYAVTIPSGLWVETLPAKEVICNELARLLGLTVPQSCIVSLSPEILRQADRSRSSWRNAPQRLAQKQCCGFRYIEPTELAFDRIDRTARTQLLGRVVFNVWVGNLRSEKVAFLRDDDSGRLRPVFFDHSRSFSGDLRRVGMDHTIGPCPKRLFESTDKKELRLDSTDKKELCGWVRKVKDFDMNPLWDLLVEIPSGWYGGWRGRIVETLTILESNRTFLHQVVGQLAMRIDDFRATSHCCWSGACPAALACKLPPPPAARLRTEKGSRTR